MRFNNDSGNNYGNKYSNDGGSDSNFTSQANIVNSATYTSDVFQLDNVINNNSSQEKLVAINIRTNIKINYFFKKN